MTPSELVAGLAQGVWIATLAAAVLAIGLAVGPRVSPATRMRVWWLGFGISIAIPLGRLGLGVRSPEPIVETRVDLRLVAPESAGPDPELAEALRAGKVPLTVNLAGAPTAARPAAGTGASQIKRDLGAMTTRRETALLSPVEGPIVVDGAWGAIALGTLVLVAVGRLLVVTATLRRTARLKRAATGTAHPGFSDATEGALAAHRDEWRLALDTTGSTRSAPLLEAPAVGGPILVGYRHPAVLVPPALLDRLSPAERRHVLLHEAVHLARRDDWTLLAQRLAEAVWWFHPGLLWMGRRLDADREAACDGAVARLTGGREYARTLVRLAELADADPSFGLAPGIATRASKLGRRVEELVGEPRRPARTARVAFLATLPIAATMATAFSPLRTVPRLSAPAPAAPAEVHRVDSTGVVTGALGVRLDSILTDYARRGFSGTVLVARRGTVVLEKGYGLADRERGIPATAATRYSLAGFTKSVTAAAALKLAEEGRISLRDSIGRWLPELTGPKRTVTIAQLLTYQDGMTRPAAPIFRATRAEFLEALDRTPAQFAPGTGFRYNDFGHSVLALIIERAAGEEYERYVRAEFIEPLGLGFGFEPYGAPLAVEYQGRADALEPIGKRGYSWGRRGSLGMVGTARDAYHWLLALDSATIISPTMRRAMLTAQGVTDYGAAATYGWELTSPRSPLGPLLRRVAGTPGMEGEILHDPSNQWSAVILVNTRLGWRFRIWDEITRLATE